MAYATSAAAAAEAVRLPGCCARPDGRGVLTEYRLALASAAASPALLGASPMSVALLFCERECPPAPASSLLAVALVRAAFSLSTDEAASTFASSMPELDVGHTSFLDRLTWEAEAVRRALARALDDARRGGDAYPLRTALGLVARGAAECASRARDVVCQLLERCVASAAGQPDGQPLLGLPPFPPGGQLAAACAANAGATAACTRVLVACAAAVHRAKEESFRTTFLEPASLWAASAGPQAPGAANVELDLIVHGAPSLAALLQAATGVAPQRPPNLSDAVLGFVDGAASPGLADALEVLWRPDNTGRAWRAAVGPGASVGPASGLAVARPPHPPLLLLGAWSGNGLSVARFAAQAADWRAENAAARRQFADVHLNQFFRPLAAPALLPRLAAALCSCEPGDVGAALAAAGLVAAPAAGDVGGGASNDDARSWLWDDDAFPPTLRLDRVRALTDALGATRPESCPLLPAGSVQCAAGAAAGAEAAAADDEAVAAIAAVAAFVAAEAQQGPLLRAARLPGLPVALDGDEVPLAPLPIRRATANAQLPPAVLARTPHASELAAAVAARDPPRDTSDAAAAATMAAMMQPLALPGAPRLHTDARFLSCADLHRARSAWPVAAAPSPGAVRVVRVPSGMRHGMNFANKGAIGASDNGYDLRSGNSEQVSLVWLTAVLELPAAASLVRARLSYRYVVGASGNLSAIGPSFTLLARVLPATAAAARAGTGEDTDGLADAHVLHQSPMFPARPFHYDRCEGGAPTNYSPPTVVDAAVSAGVALPAGSRLAIGLLLRNAGRNFHLQAAGWGAPGGRGAADDLLGLELTLVETGASEPGGAAQQAEEEAAPSAAVVLAAVVGGAGAAGPDGAQGRRARLVEKWRAARRFARSLVCFA